jgi:hypothetical protein
MKKLLRTLRDGHNEKRRPNEQHESPSKVRLVHQITPVVK